jgi:hypothetical protein
MTTATRRSPEPNYAEPRRDSLVLQVGSHGVGMPELVWRLAQGLGQPGDSSSNSSATT